VAVIGVRDIGLSHVTGLLLAHDSTYGPFPEPVRVEDHKATRPIVFTSPRGGHEKTGRAYGRPKTARTASR